MKNAIVAGLTGLCLVSGAANAISFTGQVGKDYTNAGFGVGTESTGLALSGNWVNNNDNGSIVGLGLGFTIPLGSLMATVGGKGVYLDPDVGKKGYAAAVGGGLQWPVMDSLRLFGEYYYSPDSFSSGVQDYTEANAGARYNIIRPLSIEAGYRYINLSGKEGKRDNAVADGPYVGVSASF